MAEVLIPKIQNINAQSSNEGRTLMHDIIWQIGSNTSNECMIGILKLISPISDHSIKDNSGHTAMDLATFYSAFSAIEILKSSKKRKLD